MSAGLRVIAILTMTLVAGCGLVSPSPSPTRFEGLLALPSVPIQPGELCAGVGVVGAVLAGDAEDPRIAWLEASSGRVDVVFPSWLGARFAPDLEIVDETGQVVARAGDSIDGGCVTGAPGTPLLILWP